MCKFVEDRMLTSGEVKHSLPAHLRILSAQAYLGGRSSWTPWLSAYAKRKDTSERPKQDSSLELNSIPMWDKGDCLYLFKLDRARLTIG